ncbi:MAG: calcineurin-like phosphoesterase C-terminal domain-containing protein [Pseudomonadota bacterium]
MRFPKPALIVLPILLMVSSSPALAQCGNSHPNAGLAKGTVFVDGNGNGEPDNGEPGVAGVSVSNGCEVVRTDAEGRYEISLAPARILFISQPAGYRVTVDENHLPRFHYRHYPDGTPREVDGTEVQWRYPVTGATGPLPESIDFPLTVPADENGEQFDAYAFADPQARSELDQDKLREDLITTLIGNPFDAEFGITVGDVVFDSLELYDRHKAMMALMDVPQWYLPGNHDLNFESPDARFATETYKHHFGPTYYSFNHGNVHFVALNNVEYAGDGKRLDDGDRYRGYIPEDQLYWLERDLAHVPRDRLIVIASHIPLVSEAVDDSGEEPATGPYTENFTALLEILEPFEHIYGIAGHDTSNSWKVEIGHDHGWHEQPWIAHTLAQVRGNGWHTGLKDARGVNDAMMQDGTPNGFYLLRFDDVELVPDFHPFPYGADANRHLRVMLDPPPTLPDADSINRGRLAEDTKVVVNLFDGGPRDSVWMSLDGGERQAMTYRVRTDPLAERLHAQVEGEDHAMGRPTRSSHIWELALPGTLAPGVHHIEVTSQDEFGRHRHGHLSFEVTE